MATMKIKKGDTIKILTGRDRGKTGKVTKVIPEEGRLIADGLNMYKKRIRPRQQGKKGETVVIPRPFQISNAMIVCGSCKQPTRVGFRLEGEKKFRICKKCKAVL